MNRKKKILNSLATIVYVAVITLSFLDWNRKNTTEREFDKIESNIFKTLLPKQIESELIIAYCDSLSQFISANPIDLKVDLNCFDYGSLDSSGIAAFRTDFISKVETINNEYQNEERTANRRMFVVLIVSQILLFILRKQIAKRFNIESIDNLEAQKRGK